MTPPAPRWLAPVAIIVALAGSIGRFVTTSSVWLDEALSVNIASLPLGDIGEALRHDGHPPLYYLVLHGWIEVFGSGDVAVRALSGVIAVATLPVAWLVGRRSGDASLGWLVVLVLGALPFASRYGTEIRMYSLVMLLVFLGWLAVDRALEAPTVRRLLPVTVVTGALMLTHYWSFYLIAATGAVLLVQWWRGAGEPRRAAARVLVAMVAGGVLFLPWLPSFLEQAGSTGTPWAETERPTKVLALMLADIGGVDNSERILFAAMVWALLGLALFGRARDRLTIELDLRTRPEARSELAVAALTLALAIVAAYVTSSAYAPRYLAVIVPLIVVGAAWGFRRLIGPAVLAVAIAGFVAISALGVVDVVQHERTQLDQLAGVIEEQGAPGDLVVYCPDQLGPAGSRALDADLTQLTYPDLADPERVDWVDYADRNAASDPRAFTREVLARSEGRTIWLIWSAEYRTLETQCTAVRDLLARARPGAMTVVTADSGTFFENANLDRFPTR